MSSKYVRDEFESLITTELPGIKFVGDMSAEDEAMKDFLKENTIGPLDKWIGIQFLPGERRPRAIASSNSSAHMREEGGAFIHLVSPVTLPSPDNSRDIILDLSEQVTNVLELRRFGTNNDIIIRGISTPNFEDGATLQFTDGFTSASLILDYYRDFKR